MVAAWADLLEFMMTDVWKSEGDRDGEGERPGHLESV